MKIAFTAKIISPEIGTFLAGYGAHDESVAKLDDLQLWCWDWTTDGARS